MYWKRALVNLQSHSKVLPEDRGKNYMILYILCKLSSIILILGF
jgi:hypothetical protein